MPCLPLDLGSRYQLVLRGSEVVNCHSGCHNSRNFLILVATGIPHHDIEQCADHSTVRNAQTIGVTVRVERPLQGGEARLNRNLLDTHVLQE